ncbi:hypothetical protein BV25DRAFT_1903870 [Artomyces pyxidatus]|uniref:Uncharacterized protein n=1 Tax=Artomyces pyxidatus TaxID=48021 RepID=A0ACB8SDU4_9AGAM|nr:hypothetical protein BV25DRAFT_1903870 [Artomyces pyxidatus]
MEGVIIFVRTLSPVRVQSLTLRKAGLYSASLTAFLVESYKNLQVDPAQQSVLLMQQTVALLSQITQQLGPNGSQVPVSLPEKLSEFSPSASDVRINVFWFMSLIFSLGAALAATIVQQWVRDYMHVFQRYNNSLKRARLRQYLYEGAELWKMSIIVEGVPALIHVSLFLFFIGLSDFLFHLDRIVAILVTIMISGCGLLYIGTMIAPVLYAQSPYQTPISGIFWWIFQSFGGRYHSDKSTGGERRPVSTDLTDGRVQLAMDESDERRKRDARAICWVIDNLTEDSELEPFVAGIPGSLNTSWGKEVWETVAKDQASPNVSAGHHPRDFWKFGRSQLVSSSMVHSHNAVTDFSGRITRLLKTCTDPGILIEKDRRRRARACVDAALSFVLNMDGKWEWFAEGEILADALNYLGGVEKIRLWPDRPEDFDNAFAARCAGLADTASEAFSPLPGRPSVEQTRQRPGC